jgi:hypothetical protein
MQEYAATCIIVLFLLALQKVSSEISCYDCSYRQKGGFKDRNEQCLNPNQAQARKTGCPEDKPICIKVTAITQRFGLVMERACFPQMPATCKDLDSLENTEPASLFFGATLSDVEDGDGVSKFEDVRACFCDWELCNDEPGRETNGTTDTGTYKRKFQIQGRGIGGTQASKDSAPITKVGDGNDISPGRNCSGDPSKCEEGSTSENCYTCKLGIECHRMRFAKREKCTKPGQCFVFTKFLGSYNFTERGCGSCDTFRSSESDVQDRTQKCYNCYEDLCNSLAVSSTSSIVYLLATVKLSLYTMNN